ncbi:MAG: 3-deoxy-D-manno-octulosonic acid kinase [Gammaproteobacteria bacterium]|nr:3-deoxy-D-manno-octulosonic acid kinase [Gammaproteobacteria bacterium]MBU1722340.1 3-deoxy-D-manno-octulosonic acid kinase [Gammaproteobacteria bacterium]MBU2004723.1 3-deoxy-D-manno-octulosonic acid kinase [Gammaproteobacteria bacterium]
MDIITHGNTTYGIHPTYSARFQPEHFDPTWWQAQDAIIGQSQGRGITWFVRLGQREMVLRHYYRGGILGRLLHDRYLFNGFLRSRAVMEFRLLEQMRQQGLPVPRPCAVRLIRHGLIYRTDILLERITGARDLVHILQERALDMAEWQAIGRMIRHFHTANIDHADLNSHNILLDTDGKPWLIDFDKGKQRADGSWKQANLDRLLRSLRKEWELNPASYWQQSDWQALLAGYGRNGSSS